MITLVRVPEGVDEAGVRAQLLDEHGIEIMAAFGPLRGRVWRIGTMGTNARAAQRAGGARRTGGGAGLARRARCGGAPGWTPPSLPTGEMQRSGPQASRRRL